MEVTDLKPGMILQKGKRKRIFISHEGFFIYYTTPSSRGITGVMANNFKKWMKDAEVVNH